MADLIDRTVTDYNLVTAASAAALDTAVKAQLVLGWKLYKGPILISGEYLQAMIKIKPEKTGV